MELVKKSLNFNSKRLKKTKILITKKFLQLDEKMRKKL